MDSQVEEVKSRVDIVALISEYIPLKKSGRNFKGLCPFHGEKTPSFMVNSDRQIFKCFGCGEGGDAFAFLKRMEGMEFGEALRVLAGKTGVQLKTYKPSPEEQRKENLFKVSQLAAKMYHFLLTKHESGKGAAAYLKARGVSQKSIKDFELGFAPNKRNFLTNFLTKKGFTKPEIILSGLAIQTSDGPIDRFRGRVMFPVKDAQGRVVGFSGRALGDIEPKYLNSPETPIFNKSRVLYGIDLARSTMKKERTTILVEGNLDVISSYQAGVENTVAPLGTALTENQVEILKRYSENLLFAFDTDLAGNSAEKRGIEIAGNAGLSIKTIQLGESKDPDEMIRKSPNAWKKAIKEAPFIYNFFIDAALKKYDSSTADGKSKIAAEVIPLLAGIEEDIKVSDYLKSLSAKAGIDESDLREVLASYRNRDVKTESGVSQVKEILEKPLASDVSLLIEKYLLALLLQAGILDSKVTEDIFQDLKNRELFLFLQAKAENGQLKPKKIASELSHPLVALFDDLLLTEIDEETLERKNKTESEISGCVRRLKELNLRKKLRAVSLAIKQAEASGNQQKLTQLSQEFAKLAQVLTENETP